jgi:hypothetical protein
MIKNIYSSMGSVIGINNKIKLNGFAKIRVIINGNRDIKENNVTEKDHFRYPTSTHL